MILITPPSFNYTANHGRNLYVSQFGNNSTAQVGNPLRPYSTIQAAITAAIDGDTIHVLAGNYKEMVARPMIIY